MLYSIDTCQNKVSADQCHVTISRAQVFSKLIDFQYSYPVSCLLVCRCITHNQVACSPCFHDTIRLDTTKRPFFLLANSLKRPKQAEPHNYRKRITCMHRNRNPCNFLVFFWSWKLTKNWFFIESRAHVLLITLTQDYCKERTTYTNSSEVKPDLCEDQDQQCEF